LHPAPSPIYPNGPDILGHHSIPGLEGRGGSKEPCFPWPVVSSSSGSSGSRIRYTAHGSGHAGVSGQRERVPDGEAVAPAFSRRGGRWSRGPDENGGGRTLQYCFKEMKLKRGFSPREGHAPAGILIERGIFGHFFQDRVHRHPLAHGAEGLSGTGLNAGHTFLAKAGVPDKTPG